MKIRITKNHGEYRVGEVLTVTQNVAHGLISMGVAEVYTKEKIMESPKERIMESPEDKMMRPVRRRGRPRKNSYRTK